MNERFNLDSISKDYPDRSLGYESAGEIETTLNSSSFHGALDEISYDSNKYDFFDFEKVSRLILKKFIYTLENTKKKLINSYVYGDYIALPYIVDSLSNNEICEGLNKHRHTATLVKISKYS